eukprot:PhF_6_TR19633/c0_g1_i1/m.28647
MTPYRREQYLVAKELKTLRENIAQLDEIDKKPTATATDRATISVKVRKGMQSLKEKQKSLQKVARQENTMDEFQVMNAHIERTEKLYMDRFRGEGAPPPPPTTTTPLLSTNRDSTGSYASLHDDGEFQLFFQQCKEKDVLMDRALERISHGTVRMKENARMIRTEVDVQKRMLDEVEVKADRIHEQMLGLNGKLKKTLEQVEQDKMCMYVFCCLLLLGVAGYLLYVTGVLKK